MSGNTIFRGVATALITPLTAEGIDYAAFGRVIDWQIEQGVNALVIAGTTGEGSTLTDEEHREAIENMMVYGRRLGDVCTITPSKINDSSMLIRIKTRSQVAYEDSLKAKQ